jgi:hypothetical protein
MMSVGLHCRLARPGRVAGIAEFLDFAKSYSKKDVWICTREDLADFWHENCFPRGAGSPVKPSPSTESLGEIMKLSMNGSEVKETVVVDGDGDII